MSVQKPTGKGYSTDPTVITDPQAQRQGSGWAVDEPYAAGHKNWEGKYNQEYFDWLASHSGAVGEIYEAPYHLQPDYVTKNNLLLVDGQVLAKTDYPDLWNVIVAKYHPDSTNLLKLSLQQEVGLAPKATATGIVLPSRQISAAVAKYVYGHTGRFEPTAWPYLDTVSKATRCNLICWNYHKGVFCYVSDALAGGAMIREIDPKNVTSGHSDWTVSGIGNAAKNWRYLLYRALYGDYFLIYDEGGVLKAYRISADKTISNYGSVSLQPSGNPTSSDWYVTDGYRRHCFDGYPIHNFDHSDSGVVRFYNSTTYPVFATGEDAGLLFDSNYPKKITKVGITSVIVPVYGGSSMDVVHNVFYTDENNWLSIIAGKYIYSMIDNIYRYEDYSADRILGACQSPDYYAVALAGTTTSTRGNSAVHFYSKTRKQNHIRYFQR